MTPHERLFAMVSGCWMAQAARVAAELGIADLLAEDGRSVERLARDTRCEPRALRRLMRALASLDLCAEREDGSFELRPLGALLRTDETGSLRSWTILWGRHLWPVWTHLLDSVRTGESNRALLAGAEGTGFLGSDTAPGPATFDRAMAEITRLVAADLVRACRLRGNERIVDVGGGHGALLAAILAAHPHARGVLFDLPAAIAGAQAALAPLGERCELVGGDFFDSVPARADVYLLKNVLHDWPDPQCLAVLRNCRAAMPERARLLIVDRIMPARISACPEHQMLAWMDLNMLTVAGGRERSEAEFRALLDASGLELRGVISAPQGYSVIDAAPR